MTPHWLALLVMTRIPAAAVAVTLLALHRVTAHDPLLIGVTIVWTAVTLLGLHRFSALQSSPAAWAVDGLAALALIWLSGDWRSPYYVFALTALILPVTALSFRAGTLWGLAYTAGYLAVGFLTERLGTATLDRAISLEVAATHLMVPPIVAVALAYGSEVMRRLAHERERSERLAVQAERQRIAWELHDSAKQRVHAAHLVLTAIPGAQGDADALVRQALGELRAAAADMETSVAELRTPLDGRPVDEMLRERARELSSATRARIAVSGSLPALPPLVAAHTFRIAAEALTNAVRHAGAEEIRVMMSHHDGTASVTVQDDGIGLPETKRPGSHGLRAMRTRAETISAELTIEPGPAGRGTTVALTLPTRTEER